ncbi:hypothetical protein Ac2012v2_001088 [Leucoagaricus gongylophorus]
MSVSEILSLQTTLSEALDAFRTEIAAQNLPEPSLNTSKPHAIDHPDYVPTPVMFEARRAALACLGLLDTLIRAPYDAISVECASSLVSASLRLAADLDLATVIGDSENGVSLAELVEKTGIEEEKIEITLRCLITRGIFREPQEGYFANNRMSNIIKSDQPGFHMAVTINKLLSRSASYFPEMVNNPDLEYRKKTDSTHCAFQMAYNTSLPYFGEVSWCSNDPGEATRLSLAMGGFGGVTNAGIAADFPWREICEGKDALVDVGGGQGTLSCSLATKFPGIKQLIVQDLINCREAAEAYIKSKNLSDRVIFEVQDFFAPQKRNGKYVFVLQRVIHDWNIECAAMILRRIRDVLNLDSRLLIIDSLIQSAVTSSTGLSLKDSLSRLDSNVYSPVPAPPFIPANFGHASLSENLLNVGLSAACGASERNRPQMNEILKRAYLKIKKIYKTRCNLSIIEVEHA